MLTTKQQLRYSRHFLLKEIGEQGQFKLSNSRVLIVGMGGLGCPVATYLAAAGIGRLILADGDKLELSNLQRQVLFRNHHLGDNKAERARIELEALNPEIEIEALDERVGQESLEYLVHEVDLVLDCSDNLETRYMVNAACSKASVPLVTAAAIRFEGQLALFDFASHRSPCYQCLYPDPGQEPSLNCSNSGVVGPLLGIIGSQQALLALKFLLKLPNPNMTAIQIYDGLAEQWHRFNISKNPSCPVCNRST